MRKIYFGILFAALWTFAMPSRAEAVIDEDGYMLITTAEELFQFGQSVRGGNVTQKAKIMNDIDYTTYNTSLASEDFPYAGEFDGQGHTIKVNFTFNYADAGMFDYTDPGCHIHDLHVTGNVVAMSDWTGVLIGDDRGAVVENMLITVDLVSYDDDNTMVGFVSGYLKSTVHYKNIVTAGSIYADVAYACAGVCGDINGTCYLENCLSMVETNNVNQDQCNPIYARIKGGKTLACTNVFYNTTRSYDLGLGITAATKEEVLSGKFCAMLDGGTLESMWRQNIGEDAYPNMDATHGYVVSIGGNTCANVFENDLQNCCQNIVTKVQEYTAATKANATLLQNYNDVAARLNGCTAIEEVKAVTPAMKEALEAIYYNIEGYARLLVKKAEVLPELEGRTSEYAIMLKDYLTEDMDPSDDFPYGSLSYIETNLSLNNEEIDAQIAYMDNMLAKAKRGELEPGGDATPLLENADFSNGVNGWQGDPLVAAWGLTPNVVESYNTNAQAYQVVDGLRNGVYELTMGGLCRPGALDESPFYFAYLYANDQQVPLMGLREDPLPEAAAQNYENCLIDAPGNYPSDYLLEGAYYPSSGNGVSCAIKGGRYKNRILANVTDGKLEVGVRALGTGMTYDWAIFGGTNLRYIGELSQADDALNEVLAGQVARAKTILSYTVDPNVDFQHFPSYSKNLRDQLQTLVDGVEGATTPEAKYELIGKFSALYPQILESQKAYIDFTDIVYEYIDCLSMLIDPAPEVKQSVEDTYDAWVNGAFASKEELLAKQAEVRATIDRLLGKDKMPAAADILDVVFNADGSATDISASQNAVIAMGELSVVASPLLNQNVACFAHNHEWQRKSQNYYKVVLTQNMKDKLGKCVTMETLVRPYYVGERRSGEVNTLSMQEGSGLGLLCNSKGYWMFEPYIQGEGFTGAKSEHMVTPGEWVHLLGVYDGKNIKMYVNGELCAVKKNYTAGIRWPDGNPYFVIGGDYDDEYAASIESCFQGDIATARIYSEALSDTQVKLLYEDICSKMTNLPEHSEEEAPSKGEALITSASQLSSNASDYEEGQHIEYLIDGDPATFWHTDWHGVCQDDFHYLQVALNEQFTGVIKLEMTRRNTNGNNHPTKMLVSGSKDGVEFTDITTLELPFAGVGTEVSATFYAEGMNYLRFTPTDCCTGFNKFWHCAEFQLYGDNTNAISNINAQTISKGIYNLSGQRMKKAQKGLNIINGKKVLVK